MAALKASINFGLVSIPVELLTAEDKHREHSFHMLDSKDNGRIRYKRVNENTGREVDWDDIVKGIEVKEGKYIIFTEEDLKDLQSEANRNLEIDRFIEKSSVSPLIFETPYYLAPTKGGEKAYTLLERALNKSEKYGIVQAVLRGKQQLGLIFSQDGVLVFETIRYADELKEPQQVVSFSKVKVSDKEISMAERLISEMTDTFDLTRYKDTYEEKLQEAINRKLKNKAIKTGSPSKEKVPRKSIDIMALLKNSIEAKGKKSTNRKKAA